MNEITPFQENAEITVIPPTALETMQKAEIDIQIATAHRFPRSMERFKRDAIAMATLDDETAESCIYRRPVGKDEDGKAVFAEGMSVRMAEIVGACYGNMRVHAMIVDQTERQVTARGMAIDLEKNFASSSEVIESTVGKRGNPFPERMRVVVAKAALAKARRDAMFQVVPRALARPIEAAVRRVLVGDAKTIEQRRRAVVSWIGKLGIEPQRVYAAMGVEGPADLAEIELEQLTGLRTAIKDGDVTIDEAFPPLPDKPKIEGKASAATKEQGTPPKATPQEGLRNLIAASGVTEEQVLGYIEHYSGISYNSIDVVGPQNIAALTREWEKVVADIKGGAK